MAPINTKNVHRTNFLLNHQYGKNFVYDEMMLTTLGEAARALVDATDLSAREISERALRIAGEICIYTNTQLCFEELS